METTCVQYWNRFCPTIFGTGALEELVTKAKEFKMHKILFVTEKALMDLKVSSPIKEMLEDAGFEVVVFDDIIADPNNHLVTQGAALAKETGIDGIVAVGGGSSMDCAKGIAALGGLPVRLVAVPTTSGSGSEVTSFAILTQDGVKHPLVDPALRPELAILDPALLEALPPRLIAESGMDAVSHCVEAAAAREASPVTDALAHSACRTLLRLLPRSFAGETAVRGDVHLAASMAALAFDNAGLGACHALAHALGGRFHVAHGRLCAMLLPHVIAHHAAEDPHPYAALAAACGLPGVRGLTGTIVRLRARLGLPASLPEAGVPREAVLEAETDVLEAALEDPCASQAPAPLTRDALQVLLRQVL